MGVAWQKAGSGHESHEVTLMAAADECLLTDKCLLCEAAFKHSNVSI